MDAFCSVGGLTLGLAEAASSLGYGSRILSAVDIDAKALQVYRQNFGPQSVVEESVANLVRLALSHDSDPVLNDQPQVLQPLLDLQGRVDVFVAGPPCQGNSNLNNRSRRSDPRNSLYVSAVALAIGLQARAVVLENVPDVRRSHSNVVDTAKRSLGLHGYAVDEGVLTASELGWPQRRKRHFLVASKAGLVPLAELAREFRASAPGAAQFLRQLPSRGGELERLPEYSAETLERIRYFETNPGVFDLPVEERPTCHQGGTTYMSVYGRMRPDEPVPTITSGFLTPGRGRFVHPELPRTLTPGEAAYVQGFPTWYRFDHPDVRTQDLSKWIGDAVPLPLGFVASLAVLRPLLGQ